MKSANDSSVALTKLIPWLMLFVGILIDFYPILIKNSFNVVLLVFGVAGLFFAVRDLILYRTLERLKKSWLNSHFGKMVGGYISSITAFIIVNEVFPGIYGWFIPGIVG